MPPSLSGIYWTPQDASFTILGKSALSPCSNALHKALYVLLALLNTTHIDQRSGQYTTNKMLRLTPYTTTMGLTGTKLNFAVAGIATCTFWYCLLDF